LKRSTACELSVAAPALERIVGANTLMSGLGFECGGLAAAHALHNGLAVIEPRHDYYHGEKVTFGTLTKLLLTDRPKEAIKQVYEFCSSVGLPITLADLGLGEATEKIYKEWVSGLALRPRQFTMSLYLSYRLMLYTL